jgi:hypothetical protein
VFAESLRPDLVDTYFVPGATVPLFTVYFRLYGDPGQSFPVDFCDWEFRDFAGGCATGALYYFDADGPGTQLLALSTRHMSGRVSIVPGEPTRPRPSLPPEARVYGETPTPEGADAVFELTGGTVAAEPGGFPVELFITSRYDFVGYSVAGRFPAGLLELTAIEQHAARGVSHFDNANGEFWTVYVGSQRRIGAENERVHIATLRFRAAAPEGDPIAATVALEDVFYPDGRAYRNWIGVRIAGLTASDNVELAPLTVIDSLLRISRPETSAGDANLDYGVDITDAISIIDYLFRGLPRLPCRPAADVNADGDVDISDAIGILSFLFLGGALPSAEVHCEND